MLQRRPSPAILIASIALFVALSGSVSVPQRISLASSASPQLTYTTLTLQNGWTGGAFGTRKPAAAVDSNGIVHLKGAMSTLGTNPQAFTLPANFRPSSVAYVTVDMCNATQGRIQINTNGTTIVEPENSTFSNAACFTSLDGVSYSK